MSEREMQDGALSADQEEMLSADQDKALSTDQIAAGVQGKGIDDTSPDQQSPAAAEGDGSIDDNARTQLLHDDELVGIRRRWDDIQAEFVDDPRRAVQDADALVADLMQRLARMFASERDQLESKWAGSGDVSTEELRHGLRRYRTFFERLLAA